MNGHIFVRVGVLVLWTISAAVYAADDPSDTLPAGEQDPVCLAQCPMVGEDADRCNKICALSPPASDPLEGLTDWRCVRRCIDRGSPLSQCRRPCTRPLGPG